MTTVNNNNFYPEKHSWMPNVEIQPSTSATVLYFASSQKEIDDIKKVKQRYEQETFDQDKLGDLWVVDTDRTVDESPDVQVKYKAPNGFFSNIAVELVSGSGPTLTTVSGSTVTRRTPQPDGTTLVQTRTSDTNCECPRKVKLYSTRPDLVSFDENPSFLDIPFRDDNAGEILYSTTPITKTEKGITLRDKETGVGRHPYIPTVNQQAYQFKDQKFRITLDSKYTELIESGNYSLEYRDAVLKVEHDVMNFGYTSLPQFNYKVGPVPAGLLPVVSLGYYSGIATDQTVFESYLGREVTTPGTGGTFRVGYSGITLVDDDRVKTESKNLRVVISIPQLILHRVDSGNRILESFIIAENLDIIVDVPLDIGQAECCEEEVVTETVVFENECPRKTKVEVSHPDLMSIVGLESFLDMPFRPTNIGRLPQQPAVLGTCGFSLRDENGISKRPKPSFIGLKFLWFQIWELSDLSVVFNQTISENLEANRAISYTKGSISVESDILKFLVGIEGPLNMPVLSNTDPMPPALYSQSAYPGGIIEKESAISLKIASVISLQQFDGQMAPAHAGMALFDTGETPERDTVVIFYDIGDVYYSLFAGSTEAKKIIDDAWVKITIPIDTGKSNCCGADARALAEQAEGKNITRSSTRAQIMSCAGSVEYVDGVILSSRDFDNSEELVSAVGSDLADPTADEYEGNIAGGNNTTGVTGYQDPKPKQTTLPPENTQTPNESVDTAPKEKQPVAVDCSTWDGANYDVKVGKNFILRNFTIGYPDKSKNAIVGCYFPNKLIDVGSISAQTRFCNLQALAINVLDPLWEKFGPFRINSAIRNQNTVSKGVSQHVTGEAADIQFPGWTYDQYWKNAQWVKDNLPYDQFIFEHSDKTGLAWFHLSFKKSGNRAVSDRTKVMTMYANKYNPGLKKYF